MRKVLKWLGIGLGGIVGLVLIAAVALFFIGGSRVNRSYNIQVEAVAIPTDNAAIARGQHLVQAVVGCTGCHGSNLGGDKVFEDPPIGRVYAPNITSGRGGVTGSYTDKDWVRTVRHGVNPKGKGLLIMPVEVFHNLSAQDLGAIIAYVKSVPPVDNQAPSPDIRPLGRILTAVGAFGEPVPAQLVDHTAPLKAASAAGPTAEYGKYLVSIAGCYSCHGQDLSGAQPPEPGAPFSPNLTPAGNPGKWSEADFVRALRTGATPEGRILNKDFMPWDKFTRMTDDELGAIWRYLKALPAVRAESR